MENNNFINNKCNNSDECIKLLKSTKSQNRIKGNIGENLAINYLQDNGYQIIETNYKNKIGEIDIIAKENNRIIFVEVKQRSTLKFGYPREAVNFYKQKKIRQVALSYIKYKNLINEHLRFDVIEIIGDKITHLKNAF